MDFDLSIVTARFRELWRATLTQLPNVAIAAVVFALFYLVAKLARRGMRSLAQHSRTNAALVLGRLAQLALVLIGVLVATSIVIPSFKAGDVISLLGIGGVAIGFAFRDILQNFLAGILLLIIEPFRIGDQIVVASFEGTVEEIQTRATLLKTYDGRRVVIPNATIFTEAVIVNTAYEVRRMEYDFGIGYGDSITEVGELLLSTAAKVEGVLADPAPDLLIVDFAASTVNLRLRWWTSGPRQTRVLEMKSAVMTAAKIALDGAGIDLPFPTQQILFHDQTEETDGDRTRQREGWPAGKKPPAARGLARAIGELAHAVAQRQPDATRSAERERP